MIRLSEWGTTLGTRNLGEKVRLCLLKEMERSQQPIEVSFKDVFMVSTSFADECFGKLIVAIGPQQFREVFSIVDLEDKMIKNVLNSTVKQRLALSKASQ
ncbi:STAS-like domain-containing protein [Aneurinibacillus thermoaerophilus]|uniref:STAS-like domain-containing protein n=1 Tax=Aneurinibacillus thermoaerophilus TaxID=143495 RepID=UPI002E1CFE28|nr:STAS-like domain-containing protein [Aneurinibacillus thermoaerophilus]